jgi:putative ABC transport system substrate-binding protein
MPSVGFLRSTSLADSTRDVTAFRQGLKEAGFVEGQNVTIEYRYADNQLDRLPALVADLIRRPVAVIAGNSLAMRAAKAATTTVPIVFAGGLDPVQEGLVASLNRPGGNVTGAFFISSTLGAKRLELLHQLTPKATTIGLLMSPTPDSEAQRSDVQAAAQAIGQQLVILGVHSDRDIEIDRAYPQSQDRQDAGPHLPNHTARPCRRGDRITVSFAAVHESPCWHIAAEVLRSVMSGAGEI